MLSNLHLAECNALVYVIHKKNKANDCYWLCKLELQKRLLVIILFTMFAGNMEKAPSCGVRVHAYKNGKTMEQCQEEARKSTEILSDEILKKGEVSWTRVLEVADHDELVYKLTLKYLRQGGYNIGNNKIPRVKSQ